VFALIDERVSLLRCILISILQPSVVISCYLLVLGTELQVGPALQAELPEKFRTEFGIIFSLFQVASNFCVS